MKKSRLSYTFESEESAGNVGTKVLMVTGVYPPDINGAVLQATLIADSLSDSYDFKFITSPLKLSSHVGIHPHVFRILDFGSPFRILKTLIDLVFFLGRHQFQVVHFHGFSRKVFIIAFLGKVFGAKLILKHSSFGIDDIHTLISRGLFYKVLLSAFDAFVAPASVFLVKNKGFTSRFYLIPNGVDTTRFRPLEDSRQLRRQRQELNLASSSFVVLGVGHFSNEKRLTDIIEAVMVIPQQVRPFSLVLIGSRDPSHFEVAREALTKLESLIRRAESFIDIRLIDRTANIERYMQVANVYVLSSEREGMPNSLLEAMACGVPVVSSLLPGITDWIIRDGQEGLLYKPGEISELAAKVNTFYCSDEKSDLLGSAGRDRIINMYSANATVEAYRGLYKSLTSKPTSVGV